MSFSENTEKLVKELIDVEYKNACECYGEKYNSLHEGYAVLLEEVEEVKEQTKKLRLIKVMWNEIKNDNKNILCKLLDLMEIGVICAIKELAQVGAVIRKLQNTLEMKEGTSFHYRRLTEKAENCERCAEKTSGEMREIWLKHARNLRAEVEKLCKSV